MLNNTFLNTFKKNTEKLWASKELNPNIYGNQIQPGTKWLPGHTIEEIHTIERFTKTKLNEQIISLLRFTKGLNKRHINLNSKGKHKEWVWKLSIDYILKHYDQELDYLKEALELDLNNYYVMPLYSHRYILVNKRKPNSVIIYSVITNDTIIFAKNLEEYLVNEFIPSFHLTKT